MHPNYEKIIENAQKDAKTGKNKSSQYDDSFENGSHRLVYTKAYLGAREKMGLLGKAGPGK